MFKNYFSKNLPPDPFKIGDKVVAVNGCPYGRWQKEGFVYTIYATFWGISGKIFFVRFYDDIEITSSASQLADNFKMATEEDIKNDPKIRKQFKLKKEKETKKRLVKELKEEIKRDPLKEKLKKEMMENQEI